MTTERNRNVLDETGQTMAEYAVILTLIIVVTLATFTSLGDGVANAISAVRTVFP
jgi:Flp pilus assembly pilin Flp